MVAVKMQAVYIDHRDEACAYSYDVDWPEAPCVGSTPSQIVQLYCFGMDGFVSAGKEMPACLL